MKSHLEWTGTPKAKLPFCRSWGCARGGATLKRMAMLTLALGIGLCLAIAGFAQTTSPTDKPNPAADKPCGPPDYCARTDRRVEPYPKTPPPLGPAGSTFTDPTFGSRMVRVTDAKSDPKGAGRLMVTAASAEQNTWNSTSTTFYVLTITAQLVLYDFDPSTMAIHKRNTPEFGWRGEGQFSYSQANILYGTPARSAEIQQYDLASGKISTVTDASKCLKLNSGDMAYDVSVSADDSRSMIVIGPQQNSNYVVYVYDRDKGCRWYNTMTGEIGGQWGPKGTVSIPDRYGIHNARISKSGRYVTIAHSGVGTVTGHWRIWDVETMNVAICMSECSGHRVMGYSHVVNPGGNHPLALLKHPLDHLESTSPMTSDLQRTAGYWYDSHYSWNNANPDDTNPVCFSTYRPSNPDTPATPLAVDGPWENEVLCAEMDGKGSKVWRFAHTYSTAKNGFWSTPRGNVSPDGRFFMFTSDWEDQLGRAPNGKYRTDVFIVELK